MNVFELDRAMVKDYERFARSFTKIAASDIRAQIDAQYEDGRFWPESIIQINPQYKKDAIVADLVASSALHPSCNVIFKDWELRTHQVQAIHLARQNRSFVVTTGTGSGKSLCYFIPIIDAVLHSRQAGEPKRTKAIVIYPMNALANSQLGELNKYFANVAGAHRLSYGRYTGQESDADRAEIARNPPDILLTNFMMLELLMTRQDDKDRDVIRNCEGLQFLVLDELHTYRGRQGADVAMLVRRLRNRLCQDERLLCIGTSATMTSEGGEGARTVVANVASKLFATSISADEVITETLERRTDPFRSAETVRPELAAAIEVGVPEHASDEDLRMNPLAIWIETTLGIVPEQGVGQWIRANPRRLSDAAQELADQSGKPREVCQQALERLLLVASHTELDRTGRGDKDPFFGVRLHQFLSGAGRAHATIEPFGVRKVVFDGQKFLPEGEGDKRLYALHFCHNCGQEHHPVWAFEDRLEARSIDDVPPKEERDEKPNSFGFFMPIPPNGVDFDGQPEDYPESWTEQARNGTIRLKSGYRKLQLKRISLRPDGSYGIGVEGWFHPGTFRFCAACGELTSSKGSDVFRLAGLSAEGRSSATTVLVSSILKWMNDDAAAIDDETKRKVLGFSDNRQDAALQAGHFNDFIFVSILRAATFGALRKAGPAGLDDGQLGQAIQTALGFTKDNGATASEWLASDKIEGPILNDAERTLRQVLAHRFWVDQQKIWRVTNPNLERLHLMRVEYKGLDDLVRDEKRFSSKHEILREAGPETREKAYRC